MVSSMSYLYPELSLKTICQKFTQCFILYHVTLNFLMKLISTANVTSLLKVYLSQKQSFLLEKSYSKVDFLSICLVEARPVDEPKCTSIRRIILSGKDLGPSYIIFSH